MQDKFTLITLIMNDKFQKKKSEALFKYRCCHNFTQRNIHFIGDYSETPLVEF